MGKPHEAGSAVWLGQSECPGFVGEAREPLVLRGTDVVVHAAFLGRPGERAGGLPRAGQDGRQRVGVDPRPDQPEREDERQARPVQPGRAEIDRFPLPRIGVEPVVPDQQHEVVGQRIRRAGRAHAFECDPGLRSEWAAEQRSEQRDRALALMGQADAADRTAAATERADALHGAVAADADPVDGGVAWTAESLDRRHERGVDRARAERGDQIGRDGSHELDRWLAVETVEERRTDTERDAADAEALRRSFQGAPDSSAPTRRGASGGARTPIERGRIDGASALDSDAVPSINEPSRTQEGRGQGGRVPSSVRWLAAVGILWAVVQGGLALVRLYVDSRIEGRVGEPSVDFVVDDTEGRTWRLADLRGRTVVLNFFRSRCVGCLAERDAVRALADRIDPQRAILLGVLVDRVQGFDAATTEATLARMGYTHPILVADHAFADAFHGAGWSHVTPVTYVLDGQGRITASLRGHQELDALLAALPADAVQPGSGDER